jgi:hypothetical protein
MQTPAPERDGRLVAVHRLGQPGGGCRPHDTAGACLWRPVDHTFGASLRYMVPRWSIR